MDGMTVPLHLGILRIQCEVGDDLQVSTVWLHFFRRNELHLAWCGCTPTALATSKKPTCRSILWSTYCCLYLLKMCYLSMVLSYCYKHQYELYWLTKKSPCNRSTLGMRMFLLHWSEEIPVMHCPVWIEFEVKDLCNTADWPQWLQWLWWPLRAQVLLTNEIHLPYKWF